MSNHFGPHNYPNGHIHAVPPSPNGRSSGHGFPGTLTANSVDEQYDLTKEDLLDMVHTIVTNESTARLGLLRRMRSEGDERRNIDQECGYPPEGVDWSVTTYKKWYDKFSLAARVVEVVPKECWKKPPTVYELENSDQPTEFEQVWDELGRTLSADRSWHKEERGSGVWELLKRADILSGIGRYGVIVLGVDDQRPLHEPVEGIVEEGSFGFGAEPVTDEKGNPKKTEEGKAEYKTSGTAWTGQGMYSLNAYTQPSLIRNAIGSFPDAYIPHGIESQYGSPNVGDYRPLMGETPIGEKVKPSGKRRKLLYARALPETMARILRWETNQTSPRFGLPTAYQITLIDGDQTFDTGFGLPVTTIEVHWTRVVHIADTHHQASASEILAIPRMRCVRPELADLYKIGGGGAEGFWQACIAKLSIETSPSAGSDVAVPYPQLRRVLEDVRNGISREMILKNMTAKTVAPTPPDPTAFKKERLENIAIKMGMPLPVFIGYEIGEQASENNDSSWNDRVKERNLTYTTPCVINRFIDRLILLGVLPEPSAVEEEPTVDAKGQPLPKQGPKSKDGSPADPNDKTKKAPFIGGGPKKPTPPSTKPPAKVPAKPVTNLAEGDEEESAEVEEPTDEEEYSEEDQPLSQKDPLAKGKGKNPEAQKTGYCVDWDHEEEADPEKEATVLTSRVNALKAYADSPGAQKILTPMDFLTREFGYDEVEAESCLSAAEEHAANLAEEEAAMQEEQIKAMADAGVQVAPAVPGQQIGKPAPKLPTGAKPVVPKPEKPVANFDPSQPRDSSGQWTDGGGKWQEDMFHVTSTENVEKIKAGGFKVSPGAFGAGVYLSLSGDKAAATGADKTSSTRLTIRSKITNPLTIDMTSGGPTEWEKNSDYKEWTKLNTDNGEQGRKNLIEAGYDGVEIKFGTTKYRLVLDPTKVEVVDSTTNNFDPSQPRDPGGEGGGQWVKAGAGGGSDSGTVSSSQGSKATEGGVKKSVVGPVTEHTTSEGVDPAKAKTLSREESKEVLKWKEGMTMIVGANKPNGKLPNETRPANLTDEERGALQKYTYRNDNHLNARLRGNPDWAALPAKNGTKKTPYNENFFDEMDSQMQSAFAKAPVLKTPVKVVRGMNITDPAKLEQFVKNLQTAQATGGTHTMNGYTSTAVPGTLAKLGLGSGVPGPFKGNVTMKINAVHGLDMKPHSQLPSEEEFLLPHGAQFKVKSVVQKADGWHVELDQLPPKPKS